MTIKPSFDDLRAAEDIIPLAVLSDKNFTELIGRIAILIATTRMEEMERCAKVCDK